MHVAKTVKLPGAKRSGAKRRGFLRESQALAIHPHRKAPLAFPHRI